MLRFNFKDEIPQGGNRLYNIIDKITGGIIQQNCMIQRSNGNDQEGTPITALLLDQFQNEINNNTPIGVIHEYAGTTAPTGYLLCQGQAVSRTTYADLFAVIGTTYGAGDGNSTFNVPDKRGRVSVGLNASDTDFNALGKTGGEKTHKMTVDEMPSHTHTQNAHGHTATGSSGSAGAHSHTITVASGGSHTHTASSNSTGAHTHTVSGTAASAGAHSHIVSGLASYKTGTGSPAQVPNGSYYNLYGGYLECNSAGAHTHSVSGTAASAGAHSHTITVTSAGAHSHTASSNSTGAHTHTVSVTVESATATNQNTGGGKAHNNLQPYTVTNYIIKY